MRQALVTGGGSGIGRELARELARQGFRTWICGRREKALKETAGGFREMHCLPADLCEREQLGRLARNLAAEGPLDLLVHNAGVFEAAPLLSQDEDRLRRMLRLNLEAPLLLTRELYGQGLLERGARIVNILSVAAETVFPGCSVYGASKAGLRMAMQCLREELREEGISVCNVLPGATRTPAWGEEGERLGERIMDPEELAKSLCAILLQPQGIVPEELVLRPPLGDLDG